ncbi:MAG: hypothetical protein LBK58_14465 [Prevotellaceae bacterium]|nr:hypothetical protein [Prevotellaceae bacterium]
MMKYIKYLLTVVASCLCLLSCDFIDDIFNKDKDEEEIKPLTEKEKEQINEDFETISLTADDLFGEEQFDREQVMSLVSEYKKLKSVKDAWMQDDRLVIRFERGGLVSWARPLVVEDTPDLFTLSEQAEKLLTENNPVTTRSGESNRYFPGNKDVGIINILGADFENEAFTDEVCLSLKKHFDNAGYSAKVITEEDADLDFFKSDLNKYGVIILATHGSNMGNNIWFTTGVRREIKGNGLTGFFRELKEDLLWQNDEISAEMIPFTQNGIRDETTRKRYIMISDKYIDNHYADNSFPNTLFLTISCHGMETKTTDRQFGRMLHKKGVGVTIGYSDEDYIGRETMQYLSVFLLNGYTLKESIDLLPEAFKHNYSAYLLHYPYEGEKWNMSLVEQKNKTGEVFIDNWSEEFTSVSTVSEISLSLRWTGFSRVTQGVISLNNSWANIPDIELYGDNSYTYRYPGRFLIKGLNKVGVIIYGFDNNDRPIVASKEVSINGVFNKSDGIAVVTGEINRTSNGITVYGEVFSDGGKSLTDKGFYLSKVSNSPNEQTDATKISMGSGSSSFFRNITGLEPAAKYRYMAYATNTSGTVVGEIKEFVTLDGQGVTDDINRIVPKEIQQAMIDLGLPIYGGGSPPAIAGTYKMAPCILKASNFRDNYSVGHKFYDSYITFSDQNNSNLTVKVNIVHGNESGMGTGAYIVGEGNRFTVFVAMTLTDQQSRHQWQTAYVFSGTISPEGIRNLQYSLFMIDDGGDPNRNLIENGQGRLVYDPDGLSERTSSGTRSATNDTEGLSSVSSSKN